jgi:hypothetical protein
MGGVEIGVLCVLCGFVVGKVKEIATTEHRVLKGGTEKKSVRKFLLSSG